MTSYDIDGFAIYPSFTIQLMIRQALLDAPNQGEMSGFIHDLFDRHGINIDDYRVVIGYAGKINDLHVTVTVDTFERALLIGKGLERTALQNGYCSITHSA